MRSTWVFGVLFTVVGIAFLTVGLDTGLHAKTDLAKTASSLLVILGAIFSLGGVIWVGMATAAMELLSGFNASLDRYQRRPGP